MALLSVSTWALNRQLGPLRWTKWDPSAQRPVSHPEDRPQTLPLLSLPERLRAMGLQACELGHFHLPAPESLDPAYAAEVRQAFAEAGVVLWSLLVDYGDLSSADPRRREADQRYIAEWIRLGAALGARHVRAVAGEGSPDDPAAVDRAIAALGTLADAGRAVGVGLLTENFRRLCSTAEVCTAICRHLEGRVHLTADFGNFPRASRTASLAAILPYARSAHAKPECDRDGNLDGVEFGRLLDIAADAGFDGAYTAVYEGPGDQWDGVARTADLIRAQPRALRAADPA